MLAALVAEMDSAVSVELPQDHQFLPLTEPLFKEFENLTGVKTHKWQDPFEFLALDLVGLAKDASRCGHLAYIETDYWGGDGTQCAMLWSGGSTVCEPIKTEARWTIDPNHSRISMLMNRCLSHFVATSWPLRRVLSPPVEEWAINSCLRTMGISKGSYGDEFDAIHLGRWRDNEDWIEQPTYGAT